MTEEERLLLTGADNYTCAQSFKNTSKKFQGFFDWFPLISFYALQGSVSIRENCLIPTVCGVISLVFSYARSQVDTSVVFPKVLDVGFIIIFFLFTIICFAGDKSVQYMLNIWSNALMNGLLAPVIYLGCVMNRPFVLAYALEAGLPPKMASEPSILYKLNQDAMEWVYAVLLMCFVSCIAPWYLCSSSENGCYSIQNDTYNNLNMIFTNATQYAILGYMLWKFMYLEPKKRQETEAWTFRTSQEIQAAYGVPPQRASAGKGITKTNVNLFLGVNPLARDQWGAPVWDKSVDQKLKRGIAVVARAFLNDPMVMTWPQIGNYPPDKRLKACERLFGVILRAGTPLNHTYFIDDASYIVGIPCWERGDEHDLLLGQPTLRILQWDLSPPSIELTKLRKITNTSLQGRKHLHIAIFATDPSKQGKGYGSACMRMLLDVADRKGIITSLETCTTKNKIMYEHYGFHVVGSLVVEGCTDPWYSMIRDVPSGAGARYDV